MIETQVNVGQIVNHTTFGKGVIVEIVARNYFNEPIPEENLPKVVQIKFDSEEQPKLFQITALENKAWFN